MKHVHTFESFLSENTSDTITVTLTKSAADSMERDLKANGVKYTKVKPTVFEVENSGKARTAIRLVKERFGTRAIIVKESELVEAYKPIPYNVKIAGQYEITTDSGVVNTKIAGFERQNDDSDSLYFMDGDPLRDTLGSIIVKNSDMFKLQKGTAVKAVGSNNKKEVKIKRVGDL
jgi:hypothetical protein